MCAELSNDERRKAIKERRTKISELNTELYNLKEECSHNIAKKHNSAICDICDEHCGWWCPDSPDHTCDYEQEDGEYDEDSCRYCGQPEERK